MVNGCLGPVVVKICCQKQDKIGWVLLDQSGQHEHLLFLSKKKSFDNLILFILGSSLSVYDYILAKRFKDRYNTPRP